MKTLTFIFAGLLLFSFPVTSFSQVEIDRSIQLTGGTGQSAISGLVDPPVAGTDAVNKDYVDAAVSGSGGGGLHTIGDNGLPTMMSATSPTGSHSMMTTATYCRGLSEGGYTDWRVPTFEELFYMLNNDAAYAGITNPAENFYFSVLADFGSGNSSSVGRFYVNMTNNDIGPISLWDTSSSWRARCVR